jgi:hypothetical protein
MAVTMFPISDLLGDPVLSSHLEDFLGGIEELQDTQGEEHHRAARKMCELSRTILFRLPPTRKIKTLARKIAEHFRMAADSIKSADPNVLAYRDNILARAADLEQQSA